MFGFKGKQEDPAAATAARVDIVLYRTSSLCLRCTVTDRQGLVWRDAAVVDRGGRAIVLSIRCPTHGHHNVLYCSDPAFFRRQLAFKLPPSMPMTALRLSDTSKTADELVQQSARHCRPAVVDLAVFGNEGFVDDDLLCAQLAALVAQYPKGRGFVLRAQGRLAPDMARLNGKLKLLAGALPWASSPMLVEASFDRLLGLCELEDSVFESPRVYPAVKYYLKQGDEDLCMGELQQFFEQALTFQRIQIVLTLNVQQPWPDLSRLLPFLLNRKGLVRVIFFTTERPFADVTAHLQPPPPPQQQQQQQAQQQQDSVDIYSLLKEIERVTNGGLSPDDFYPTAIASAFEPFLALFGAGLYDLKPAAGCGVATLLVNTDEYKAVPVGRLLHVDKIYEALLPLLSSLTSSISSISSSSNATSADVSVFTGIKLKRIFSSAWKPKGAQPDLLAFLTDKDKQGTAYDVASDSQFIVVRQSMDFGCLGTYAAIERTTHMMETADVKRCPQCVGMTISHKDVLPGLCL